MSPRRGGPSVPLRAVVIDVDGTVTDADRRLDPRALACLRALERRRIPVVVATGNVLPVALALGRFVGLSGPIVAENGGLLLERDGHGERVRKFARREIALRAFRTLRAVGIPAERLFTDRWRETEVGLEPTISVRAARSALRGQPVDVVPTGFAIHLIERGAGKLPALVAALEPYRLAPADCLIAGDGDNDVPMLRAAGWAVSFRSASARARRAADYVAHAEYAAGFVEAVMRARLLPNLGTRG